MSGYDDWIHEEQAGQAEADDQAQGATEERNAWSNYRPGRRTTIGVESDSGPARIIHDIPPTLTRMN